MSQLTSNDLVVFFFGLSALLGMAHAFGEVARRLGQPVVIGEMLAGLLLGPTCLGRFAPAIQSWLFPAQGPAAVALWTPPWPWPWRSCSSSRGWR